MRVQVVTSYKAYCIFKNEHTNKKILWNQRKKGLSIFLFTASV